MTKSVFTNKYKFFCELLMKARKDAGISQAFLAKKLKKHQSFISKIEQLERRLDFVEFLEIANILKIDIPQFINELEEITKQNKKKQQSSINKTITIPLPEQKIT